MRSVRAEAEVWARPCRVTGVHLLMMAGYAFVAPAVAVGKPRCTPSQVDAARQHDKAARECRDREDFRCELDRQWRAYEACPLPDFLLDISRAHLRLREPEKATELAARFLRELGNGRSGQLDRLREDAANTRREAENLAAEMARAKRERADKERVERERADKEQAERERADKEQAHRERADKERADKERADKERTDKERDEEAAARRQAENRRRRGNAIAGAVLIPACGAAFAGSIAFGSLANHDAAVLRDWGDCHTRDCPPYPAGVEESRRRFQSLFVGTLVAGGALAVVGAIWLVYAGRAARSPAPRALSVVPAASPDGAFVHLVGSF